MTCQVSNGHLSPNGQLDPLGSQQGTGHILLGEVHVVLSVIGAPTGTISENIRKGTDDSVAVAFTTYDVSQLSSSWSSISFTPIPMHQQ